MDGPEYLAVVSPQVQEDQNVYNVEVYTDVENQYVQYTIPVVSSIDCINADRLLESNLHISTPDLFEARCGNIKLENIELHPNDGMLNVNATDDESMAVEALRQLGNSTYKSNNRIETTTPHDLPLLPCTTCDLEFRTTADLNNHTEICRHSQFICAICSDVFERKIDFNNHLVCHAVERPHSCRICGNLFIHNEDLQLHMITHGTKHLNACQVCGQQFNRPSSLTNHMKIHNYQAGRGIVSPKIENCAELTDILTEGMESTKIILPSINNMAPLNNWNVCYDPDNFQSDINLDVAEDVTIDGSVDEHSMINENDSKPENFIHPLENKVGSIVATLELHKNNKKPYNCSKCNKNFAREKALISHLKLHKDVFDDDYSCERCAQSFNNATALEKHLQHCGIKTKVLKMKKLEINEVIATKIVAPNKLMKINNIDVSAYKKLYKHGCTECGKNFTTKQKLFRHMWIHRKKVYACELCTQSFEEQERLDSHRLATHQSGSQYVCPECGKNFSSRQGLWEHNRIHTMETNSFKCVECNKSFTSRQGYLIHKRKHSDERPYGCRFCWKAFRDGGTLRKHERIHTGERPHACPICTKAFNQKVVLREHVRWIHTASLTPNDEGFYECTICAKQIIDKDELCAHFVRHSDEMAQIAKCASKSNITKIGKPIKNLIKETVDIQHSISVVVENNIVQTFDEVVTTNSDTECDLCGNIFLNKDDLSEHVRIHI